MGGKRKSRMALGGIAGLPSPRSHTASALESDANHVELDLILVRWCSRHIVGVQPT